MIPTVVAAGYVLNRKANKRAAAAEASAERRHREAMGLQAPRRTPTPQELAQLRDLDRQLVKTKPLGPRFSKRYQDAWASWDVAAEGRDNYARMIGARA